MKFPLYTFHILFIIIKLSESLVTGSEFGKYTHKLIHVRLFKAQKDSRLTQMHYLVLVLKYIDITTIIEQIFADLDCALSA